MAHSPQKRAEAVADIASGMSWAKAAAKHGVGKASLKLWVDEAKSSHLPGSLASASPIQPVEARKEQFNEALDGFLFKTLEMLDAWAKVCSDPAFIQKDPQGVNELGRTVLERADRLVSTITGRNDSGQA